MNNKLSPANVIISLFGAIVGGTLGYYLFFFIARQGLYALVLPGALLGLGCGLLLRKKSVVIGVICGFSALLLGLVIEWRFAPFIRDGSFNYFITHVHKLRSMTLFMIAVGAVMGFWLGQGRNRATVPELHPNEIAD